ncbi:MAG: wax ester/triacylglycerol synthase family O-acyltransferase [Acidimicrobiia bacterium]
MTADASYLSDAEALMWRLDRDPALSSTVANLSVLGRLPDVDRLRHRLERTSRAVPRLRQRVVPGWSRLTPPRWQLDPAFDLDYHLRRRALPGPGTERQLLDLVSELMSAPFDRARPLWEFTLIEGLADGRAALVQKMHHALSDGEAAVQLALEYIDLEHDQPERDEAPLPGLPAGDHGHDGVVPALSAAARLNQARLARFGRRAVAAAGSGMRRPDRRAAVADAARRATASIGRALRQHRADTGAGSPLWAERNFRPHLEVLRVPFEEVRHASKVLECTINDIFVTAVVGAAGAYHRDTGSPVGDLVMAMPVSTRADGKGGGNAFSLVRVAVPAGETDPLVRLAAVRDRMVDAKEATGSPFARLAQLLPTAVLVRLARRRVRAVDFTASNIAGAPFALYMGGAPVEATYPVGPLGGTAWNLTMLSVNGSFDMGLVFDAGAVTDPARLRAGIESSFAQLLATVGPGGREASPAQSAMKTSESTR